MAAMCSHKGMVEILLKSEAEINTVDNNRWTPLHLATGNGCIETVRTPLRKGQRLM
ncbi:MAG: ankyrin repeat domain-containing protein [Wolbachia sp.]